MTTPTKTAVILAAGRGSRLEADGSGEEYAKPLVSIAGKTLLQRTIEGLRAGGMTKIIVVTGFRHELVGAEALRHSQGDVEVALNERWQLSNGVSLLAAAPRLSGNFVLTMSDHLFDASIIADLAKQPLQGDGAYLAVDYKLSTIFDMDDATKVWIDGGRITKISKALTDYNAVDIGLFHCSPRVVDALNAVFAARGDCSLSEGMAEVGGRGVFWAYDIGDRQWQDVDTPEMYEHAEKMLGAR